MRCSAFALFIHFLFAFFFFLFWHLYLWQRRRRLSNDTKCIRWIWAAFSTNKLLFVLGLRSLVFWLINIEVGPRPPTTKHRPSAPSVSCFGPLNYQSLSAFSPRFPSHPLFSFQRAISSTRNAHRAIFARRFAAKCPLNWMSSWRVAKSK